LKPQTPFSVYLRVALCPPCLLLILALAGCRPSAPTITGKNWVIVAIGAQVGPVGAGGQPLTMNFDAEGKRVSGFGGCNQYGASAAFSGDSVAFGPVVSTKMACEGFDSLEQAFLDAIPAITRSQVTDSTLLLFGGAGVAVRLREAQN
jgi:heat shock protein HslJ